MNEAASKRSEKPVRLRLLGFPCYLSRFYRKQASYLLIQQETVRSFHVAGKAALIAMAALIFGTADRIFPAAAGLR